MAGCVVATHLCTAVISAAGTLHQFFYATLDDSGKLRVHFIHLNHSNPALEPGSTARKHIESQGFHVGRSGLEVAL